MLRHVQQYAFFDETKVGEAVRFVNLSAEAIDHDLDSIMKRMLAEIEAGPARDRRRRLVSHGRARERVRGRSSRSSCSGSRFT